MEQVEDRNEQLLLQQLSEGNAEAFRHLYVRYYPKIYYFVQGIIWRFVTVGRVRPVMSFRMSWMIAHPMSCW